MPPDLLFLPHYPVQGVDADPVVPCQRDGAIQPGHGLCEGGGGGVQGPGHVLVP